MTHDSSGRRMLQQQRPAASGDRQQQQSGSTDFQQKPSAQQGGQFEAQGGFGAPREYQKNLRSYLDRADIQADAGMARARSHAAAGEPDPAERRGSSHAKGER